MTANKKTERFIEIWQDENENKSRIGPHFRRRESLTIPISTKTKKGVEAANKPAKDWALVPEEDNPLPIYEDKKRS